MQEHLVDEPMLRLERHRLENEEIRERIRRLRIENGGLEGPQSQTTSPPSPSTAVPAQPHYECGASVIALHPHPERLLVVLSSPFTQMTFEVPIGQEHGWWLHRRVQIRVDLC